jgi:2-(1,2-epoxy-1,2-dihydrophenyl)acetyl-CoA isomerase
MKIKAELNGAVLVGRFCDTEVRNAVTAELKEELEVLVDRYAADSAARCLLLTGSGGHFSAGGDIRSFGVDRPPHLDRKRMADAHRIAQKMFLIEKPIVTAVNGAAIGAGFGLALLGDIVIASQDAVFKPGFLAMGLVPDYGLAQTLTEIVGAKRAADIFMTSQTLTADDALRLGIVSRVYPDEQFEQEALDLAQKLASGATLALGMTKKLLQAARQTSTLDFMALEAACQAVAMGSADHRAAVQAFFAKTRPEFTGN